MADTTPPRSPAPPRLITVFAPGCGAQTFGFGPLARQLADSIADGLNAFGGLLAQPHHLLGLDDPEAITDPNLEEGFDPALDEDAPLPDRIEFILFSSLPSDALVRRLALERGAPYAVSGRLVVEGQDVDLALNVWDVGPPNLLGCSALFGTLSELPELVAQVIGDTAWRLQADGAARRDQARDRAREALGTSNYHALRYYAAATDLLRRAALRPNARPRSAELLATLCAALAEDPSYAAPRVLLLEQAVACLRRNDEAAIQALSRGLERLDPDAHMIFALLRIEAYVALGDLPAAETCLKRAAATFGADDPRVQAAQRRLVANAS